MPPTESFDTATGQSVAREEPDPSSATVERVTNVNSWQEFEEGLKTLRKQLDLSRGQGPLLFRGQDDSRWGLASTLERRGKNGMLFRDYYRLIDRVRPQIESLTNREWPIPEFEEVERWTREYDGFSLRLSFGRYPAYAYMVYLRHYGFPSPLLDWTRSPQVAAWFAFNKPANKGDADRSHVSIYVLADVAFKMHGNQMPMIVRCGPYVRTDRRHFLQECEYTMCIRFDDEWRFHQYENVFDPGHRQQGHLWKFNIPLTQRPTVLKVLDSYNLNAFSLFGSEESLMETMAFRELELGG